MTVNILVLHGMNRPGVNEVVNENFGQLFNDAQLTYYLAKESGAANGIVSMMGGLGGFFPPIVIAYITGLTDTSHLAFVFLALFGVIAIITMYHIVKRDNLSLKQ